MRKEFPKSQILHTPSQTRTFFGFKSKCKTFCSWQWFRPLAISKPYAISIPIRVSAQFSKTVCNSTVLEMYSITIKEYCLVGDVIKSKVLTIFLWSRLKLFRSLIRDEFFAVCTVFTATNFPFFFGKIKIMKKKIIIKMKL